MARYCVVSSAGPTGPYAAEVITASTEVEAQVAQLRRLFARKWLPILAGRSITTTARRLEGSRIDALMGRGGAA